MPRGVYNHVRRSAAVRLWSKVSKHGPKQQHMKTRCWVWTGCRHKRWGYGTIRDDAGKVRGAHVVAWEERHGPVPAGKKVLHACDHPPCVRHLFLGTTADNQRDMAAKGRSRRGSLNVFAKLDERSVRRIRRLYATGGVTYKALAAKFGVHKETVLKIVNRRTWCHVA